MKGYVLRRVGEALATLFGVSSAVFIILHLSGDPTALLLPPDASAQAHEVLRHQLGFDRPIIVQYLDFLAHLLRGDLGESLRGGVPALQLVLERMPATALLAFTAIALSLLVAIPLGTIAGRKRGSIFDAGFSVIALAGQSIPIFWMGQILILIFAVGLGILPPGGGNSWTSLILPAVSLSFFSMARTARVLRSGILEVQTKDYVRTAFAKGLSQRAVVSRHVLRNALLPVVTLVGLDLAAVLGGAVVIESVFSWPGVGHLTITSIEQRDFPVVQAAVLVIAFIYVIVNLIVDLLYRLIDPRVGQV